MNKMLLIPVLCTTSIGLAACADNYAAEGGLVGGAAGAGLAALTGEDLETFALAGAAAGGLAGYFRDKNDDCDGYHENGYLDEDCFGEEGYPDDPR